MRELARCLDWEDQVRGTIKKASILSSECYRICHGNATCNVSHVAGTERDNFHTQKKLYFHFNRTQHTHAKTENKKRLHMHGASTHNHTLTVTQFLTTKCTYMTTNAHPTTKGPPCKHNFVTKTINNHKQDRVLRALPQLCTQTYKHVITLRARTLLYTRTRSSLYGVLVL